MDINNKYLILIVIGIILLLWYVKSVKNNVSRYENIIDTYMTEEKKQKEKEKQKKKVRFSDSDRKK